MPRQACRREAVVRSFKLWDSSRVLLRSGGSSSSSQARALAVLRSPKKHLHAQALRHESPDSLVPSNHDFGHLPMLTALIQQRYESQCLLRSKCFYTYKSVRAQQALSSMTQITQKATCYNAGCCHEYICMDTYGYLVWNGGVWNGIRGLDPELWIGV